MKKIITLSIFAISLITTEAIFCSAHEKFSKKNNPNNFREIINNGAKNTHYASLQINAQKDADNYKNADKRSMQKLGIKQPVHQAKSAANIPGTAAYALMKR